ncbi:MAG: hypothetical protein IM492_12670 [Microcystis sp. M040S2]|nr:MULTISPECIES: hypothetical protein [unclassified Microcystis]MCA2621703.1 hypothetical protein [Microcystis sp. M099S2]MCA2824325.1 hypothetical protein [Microcystis sp. M088S1]MCA2828103.1 hypothetical protein [Microcystis sp. M086S1]MCA2912801.1 hypothetical protein [Microcystis sp. M022S1]MCA2697001.1 hypothetical protein [Microcystis sp. M040S2]
MGKWGSGEVGKWGISNKTPTPQHPNTPTPKTPKPQNPNTPTPQPPTPIT